MTRTPPVGTPEKRDTGWFVPSGAVGYYVERVDGRWRCVCPSFRWTRKGTCKHVEKVREMGVLATVDRKPPFRDSAPSILPSIE